MVGKLAQDVEMVQDLVPCLVAFGISIPTCLFSFETFLLFTATYAGRGGG